MARFRLRTLAEIISEAANEIGIAQQGVSAVINSPDQDIRQMQALLAAVATEVLENEPYDTILGDGFWVIDNATHEFKEACTADNDIIAFDHRLAVAGVKWRFLKGKGLEFGEEQRDFISTLNRIASRANARVLDLDMDWSRVQ